MTSACRHSRMMGAVALPMVTRESMVSLVWNELGFAAARDRASAMCGTAAAYR